MIFGEEALISPWASPELVATIVAGALGIVGVLVGGALGFWSSHRLERASREEERNRISYAIFAGLLAIEDFLQKVLELEVSHPSFKIRRLSVVDFYWKVLEANLGNLGALGPGEAVMLYSVYADLKIIHGRSVAIVAIADNDDVGIGRETCDNILQQATDTLDEIGVLMAIMASEHGWETLTEEDLKKFGVAFPSEDQRARE